MKSKFIIKNFLINYTEFKSCELFSVYITQITRSLGKNWIQVNIKSKEIERDLFKTIYRKYLPLQILTTKKRNHFFYVNFNSDHRRKNPDSMLLSLPRLCKTKCTLPPIIIRGTFEFFVFNEPLFEQSKFSKLSLKEL